MTPTQREYKDEIEELRDRYQHLHHRNLHIWSNESQAEFSRRKHRWRQRQIHLHEAIRHLRDKREAKRKAKEEREDAKDGLVTFDGVVVAAWIGKWLEKSRVHGWNGTVTSGYRDPAYSEQLCYNMCGAPSCPGLCAGKSSNHSGKVYPAGAIDVTDFTNFERIQFEISSPLRNDLPLDPVHFSVSGR